MSLCTCVSIFKQSVQLCVCVCMYICVVCVFNEFIYYMVFRLSKQSALTQVNRCCPVYDGSSVQNQNRLNEEAQDNDHPSYVTIDVTQQHFSLDDLPQINPTTRNSAADILIFISRVLQHQTAKSWEAAYSKTCV